MSPEARIQRGYLLLWLGGWLILLLSSLLTRPLLPIDETRYVSVAWEMWERGNFLLPTLNGEPYSHKPPLLAWLIHLGWWLGGVNEWWPRLVAPLFALGALLLTRRLARQLWPERPQVAVLAPTLLLGTMLWMLFIPLTMFDMILTFWVLLAFAGLLTAAGGSTRAGFVLAGAATGLGLLAKGPVMLLHTLPAALSVPWLHPGWRGRRGRWYGGLALAVIAGIAIVLAWAVPAALSGGEAYARAIFWGQTSGRVVASFAHQAPWWWYLALLPLILFPWVLWPPLWAALRRTVGERGDWAVRFCLAWLLPVFIAFSLISGKRPHYLLPLLPAFALLSARALSARNAPVGGAAQWPVALGLAVLGLVVLLLPGWHGRHAWPAWIAQAAPGAGAVLLMAALAVLVLPRGRAPVARRVTALAVIPVVAFTTLKVLIYPQAMPYYDLRALSVYIGREQQRGVDVAHLGKYHDQFQFLGRLRRPITVVGENEALVWARRHPEGRLIVYYDDAPRDQAPAPLYVMPYRGSWIAVWSGRDVSDHPELLHSG